MMHNREYEQVRQVAEEGNNAVQKTGESINAIASGAMKIIIFNTCRIMRHFREYAYISNLYQHPW
jgi:hypothetical protein